MYRVIEESHGRYEILFVGSYKDCEKYAESLRRKVFIEKDFSWIATHFDRPGVGGNKPENPR